MKIKRRGDEPRAFCSKSFDGYYFFAAFFAGAFLTVTFLGMRRRSKTVGEVAKGDGGADLKGPRHDV